MNKWMISFIKIVPPFDQMTKVVEAETIVEAFDEKVHKESEYYARSARVFNDVLEA